MLRALLECEDGDGFGANSLTATFASALASQGWRWLSLQASAIAPGANTWPVSSVC